MDWTIIVEKESIKFKTLKNLLRSRILVGQPKSIWQNEVEKFWGVNVSGE